MGPRCADPMIIMRNRTMSLLVNSTKRSAVRCVGGGRPTADRMAPVRTLVPGSLGVRDAAVEAHTVMGGIMRTTVIICAVGAALCLTPGTATASKLKPVLEISAASAPIRTDVPYRITVKPAAKAKGKRVRLQVKGYTGWKQIDTFRVGKSGVIEDDVEGYQPGIGRYRVLVIGKNGVVMAKSPVVSVSWTPREP